MRLTLAGVFFAHGFNHIYGGGKIAGTGRWFQSLGMRPGWFHAWMASLTEMPPAPSCWACSPRWAVPGSSG